MTKRQQGLSRPGIHGIRGVAIVSEVGSNDLTRDINRDIILERIRALQPIARVDLARASGLQPSTVSSIIEQLLEERWIREGAVVKTARGRRPTMLTLNDDLVILAADVRPTQAVIAVIDLNGRFLSRMVVPLALDASTSIATLASAMDRMRLQHPDKTFEGIGLSVPGRVDPETNRLVLAPNLHWKNYDICGDLGKRLGLRVELENDANACLLAELWFGHLDDVQDAVLLAISEGLGASLLAGGKLITGDRGLAGEFGHICVDPNGPPCGCGRRGCWEMMASSRAALRYYSELEPDAGMISMSELIALVINGDPSAKKAIERQSVEVGKGLHMVTASLSPAVILFAGDITTFWDISREIIERECTRDLMANATPKLVSTGDGELALLRGAAAVVLQRHSGYYRTPHRRRAEKPVAPRPAKKARPGSSRRISKR